MLEYRCPRKGCSALLFKADQHVVVGIEIKCHGCSELVEPAHSRQPMHREYRCMNDGCERTIHVERPENRKTFCVVCGTESLKIVSETPGSRTAEKQEMTVR